MWCDASCFCSSSYKLFGKLVEIVLNFKKKAGVRTVSRSLTGQMLASARGQDPMNVALLGKLFPSSFATEISCLDAKSNPIHSQLELHHMHADGWESCES